MICLRIIDFGSGAQQAFHNKFSFDNFYLLRDRRRREEMAQFLNLLLVMVVVFAMKSEALGRMKETFERSQGKQIQKDQVGSIKLVNYFRHSYSF